MRTNPLAWMTDEHVMLADTVRRFVADELAPNAEQWDKDGIVPRDFWDQAGELGLLGAAIPTQYGGSGGDYGSDFVIAYEQARVGDVGWGYGVHSIVIHYILNCATEEQKQRWLPKLASGEFIAAIAMSEPGAGSDLQGIKTTAVRDGEDFVISGAKTFITNGINANFIIVVAKTDLSQGAKGTSLIVVETDGVDGFSRGRNLDKIGLKSQDTAELFFEDVRTPVTNLLGGEEGRGFYQLMQELGYERVSIGVLALGCCDYALDLTVKYCAERKAFGKALLEHQNTRFKLAECKTKVEAMRALVNKAIEDQLAGTLTAETASMVKLFSSETQGWVIDECLQLHGGYGYMTEFPIARLYVDARVQRIYGGTSEIMKEVIARSLTTQG